MGDEARPSDFEVAGKYWPALGTQMAGIRRRHENRQVHAWIGVHSETAVGVMRGLQSVILRMRWTHWDTVHFCPVASTAAASCLRIGWLL